MSAFVDLMNDNAAKWYVITFDDGVRYKVRGYPSVVFAHTGLPHHKEGSYYIEMRISYPSAYRSSFYG